MKITLTLLVAATVAACTHVAIAADQATTAAAPNASIERGRYLAKVAGCNDCHTANYAQSGGNVPEKDWLTGDHVGWQGPWGTTYPSNLRLALGKISEDEWVKLAKTAQYRPPMPWFALRDMTEQDLRALHRFVKALGPAGQPAPAYLPPGIEAKGPVITFPAPPQKSAAK